MIFCNDAAFIIIDRRFRDNVSALTDGTDVKVWGEWIWEGDSSIIERKLERLATQTSVPHIIVMLHEPNHPGLFDVLDKYQTDPRFQFFGDFLPNRELPKHKPTVGWFVEPTNFYSSSSFGWQANSHSWAVDIRSMIHDYTPNRPKLFDALLGMQKPHRDFVYDFVTNDSVLKEQIFLSYFKEQNKQVADGQWDALNIPGYRAYLDPEGQNFFIVRDTGEIPNQSDYRSVSRQSVVPWDIYNQSYYSVITESWYQNTLTQFTEKTAKPLIGRRPFVAFAGWRYLHNLRRLGFRTFDGIIDESYDEIEIFERRWQRAADAMKALSLEDPKEIYQKTQEIRTHNYNHFLNTNWYQPMIDELDGILSSKEHEYDFL